MSASGSAVLGREAVDGDYSFASEKVGDRFRLLPTLCVQRQCLTNINCMPDLQRRSRLESHNLPSRAGAANLIYRVA